MLDGSGNDQASNEESYLILIAECNRQQLLNYRKRRTNNCHEFSDIKSLVGSNSLHKNYQSQGRECTEALHLPLIETLTLK